MCYALETLATSCTITFDYLEHLLIRFDCEIWFKKFVKIRQFTHSEKQMRITSFKVAQVFMKSVFTKKITLIAEISTLLAITVSRRKSYENLLLT